MTSVRGVCVVGLMALGGWSVACSNDDTSTAPDGGRGQEGSGGSPGSGGAGPGGAAGSAGNTGDGGTPGAYKKNKVF